MAPNSLRLNGGLGSWVAKKSFAERARLRLKAKTLPCRSFVPDLVATTTCAPPRPNSADAPLAMTLNSAMASSDGMGPSSRSLPTSLFVTPSTVMLIDPKCVPPEMSGLAEKGLRCTPGASASSVKMSVRPFSGMAAICRPSTTLPTDDRSDSTTGAVALTSTSVATSPTSSATSSRTVWFTDTLTLRTTRVLNPAAETFTRYRPGSTFGRV